MFTLILLASSVAVVLGAPPRISGSPNEVPIISQEIVVNGDGSYRHSYESGDGTKVQESGQLKSLGPQEDGEAVQGSFSYIGTDGGNYALSYTADENGFVPQAAHLPVAPEIPEAIARSIAYNLAHPEEDTSQKL